MSESTKLVHKLTRLANKPRPLTKGTTLHLSPLVCNPVTSARVKTPLQDVLKPFFPWVLLQKLMLMRARVCVCVCSANMLPFPAPLCDWEQARGLFPRKRPHTLEKCCSPAGGGHRSFKSGRKISVHHPLVPLTSRYGGERARDYTCDDTRMVRNSSAVLLVKACMNTLGLLGGGA